MQGSHLSADPFSMLAVRFGEGLAVARDATSVCWTYDGQSATASLRENGVEATFIDRAAFDAATREAAAAVYVRPATVYRLDAAGCARMVDDVVAFFSGMREPRFAFVAIEAAEAA